MKSYGYICDPKDKKKWIVDEAAAEVVRRIFDLCLASKGPMQIAKILQTDKIPTTKAYYAMRDGKPLPEEPYKWNDNSVVGILERMDYAGHTVSFKTDSKSYKFKKRIPTPEDELVIFRDTRRPSFQRNSGNGCRSSGKTSDALQKPKGRVCSQDCCTVPIAGVSSILPPARTSTAGKTITAALSTRAIGANAPLTTSGKTF